MNKGSRIVVALTVVMGANAQNEMGTLTVSHSALTGIGVELKRIKPFE